jgi:hypothetical protein
MRLGPALLLVASLVGSGCTTQPAPTLAAVRSGTSRPTASASRPLWTPYATPTLTPFGYRVMPAEGEVWSVTTDGASIAWIETAPLREDGVARRRFVGAASSEVLYRARPGTILQDLVVAGDHFAVVEVTAHPDDAGQFSWRLLYGAAPGATPVVLAGEERSVTRLGVVPEMAMDDRRLVLTVQHGDLEADVWTNELLEFDLQTWGELPLEVYAQDTANALMQARVAGDLAVWLLAYDRHDGEGRDVEIHYAELPPPG